MRHILAFSGGKDSTYLLYEILRRKMPLDEIAFQDCGLEFPSVYAWLDELESRLGVQIKRYPSAKKFEDLFYRLKTRGKYAGVRIRGFPPVRCGCWIQRDLKMKQAPNSESDITYLGICADEPRRVRKVPYLRYPLVEWGITQEEVRKRLEELNLLPPYYREGFSRSGCWLCPKQPQQSLRILWRNYPDLWERLKVLERDSPHGFKDNITLAELEARFKEEMTLATRGSGENGK